MRRETAEGLEVFRRQQDEADRKARGGEGGEEATAVATEEEQWVAGGRKRKRAKDKEGLKGVKVRRSSSGVGVASSPEGKKEAEEVKSTNAPKEEQVKPKDEPTKASVASKPAPAAAKASTGRGLVDYGSDDDD